MPPKPLIEPCETNSGHGRSPRREHAAPPRPSWRRHGTFVGAIRTTGDNANLFNLTGIDAQNSKMVACISHGR